MLTILVYIIAIIATLMASALLQGPLEVEDLEVLEDLHVRGAVPMAAGAIVRFYHRIMCTLRSECGKGI